MYVTGVEETCYNEDIARIFEAHGKIEKIVRVPDEPEQPAGRVLIQYLSEKYILRISPDFLGDLPSPKDPAMTWHEHRKNTPPAFPELLLSVRTEEDKRAAKMDRKKKHLGSTKAAAHAHSMYGIPVNAEPLPELTNKCEQDETQKLKGEIAALKKQVAYLSKKDEVKGCEIKAGKNSKESAGTGDCLVASSNVTSDSTTMPKPWFCFKCGEDGHIAVRCSNEPNPGACPEKEFTAEGETKEIQEIARAITVFFKPLTAPAEGHSGAASTHIRPTMMVHNTVSYTRETQTNNRVKGEFLPQGLIGQRCVASVLVEGNSLLDTGSQVTTVSETFYSTSLSLPIQPIHALFEIEGAGGQHVPYLCYVQVAITFPCTVTGAEKELSSLVLVVPDCHFNSKVPLDRLYQQGIKRKGAKFFQ